jgi:hypothetical protein
MTDHEVFETRLRTALDCYVTGGPTEFDAFDFARTVASAEPRRQGRGVSFGWPRLAVPQLFWIVLATALLLAALAASALLIGSRPGPAPLLEPGPASWQRIELPGAANRSSARMTDLVGTEDGYRAVGNQGFADQGYVWASADGVAWHGVPTGDLFTGAQLNGLIRTGDGYSAVGTRLVDGHWRGSVWRSADGETWRPAASVAGSDRAIINDVVFAHGRYVAVGGELLESGYLDFIPRIWISTDAEHWTVSPSAAVWNRLIGGEFTTVVVGGPGFVATGRIRGVWSSPDGDAWMPVTEPPVSGEWFTDDVAIGRGGRIVVVGGPALVRVSDDGATWTTNRLLESPQLDVVADGHEETRVAATDWGYAALYVTDSGGPALLGTSSDATTWVVRELDFVPRAPQIPELTALLNRGDALIVSTTDGNWLLPGDTASAGG